MFHLEVRLLVLFMAMPRSAISWTSNIFCTSPKVLLEFWRWLNSWSPCVGDCHPHKVDQAWLAADQWTGALTSSLYLTYYPLSLLPNLSLSSSSVRVLRMVKGSVSKPFLASIFALLASSSSLYFSASWTSNQLGPVTNVPSRP